MTEAKHFSASIISAVQATGDAVDSQALLDALMVVTSIVLLGPDEEWTDEGLEALAASYGDGIAGTLVNIAKIKREGGVLPCQVDRTKHYLWWCVSRYSIAYRRSCDATSRSGLGYIRCRNTS